MCVCVCVCVCVCLCGWVGGCEPKRPIERGALQAYLERAAGQPQPQPQPQPQQEEEREEGRMV